MQKHDEALAMLQAAVLGQTFALLSGVGISMSWSASSKMLTYISSIPEILRSARHFMVA